MDQTLLNLTTIAPVVGVLIWVVLYFQKQITEKNTEIKELNNQLRQQQKETIVAVEKLITVVESLRELIKQKIS